ncbi:hypothetical protein V8C42DRAFT_257456 [Trichoderma barbatum]
MKQIVSLRTDYNETQRLKAHAEFLHAKSNSFLCARSQVMCYGCFVGTCDIFLPCGCGICHKCCRLFGQSTQHSPVKSFRACFVCGAARLARVRLPPLTAGYRILELDGGGVRGINQLVVLGKIQEQTGLPVHIFFDLAVGTSVGKRICEQARTLSLLVVRIWRDKNFMLID